MTLVQAGQAKKITVAALATLALAGCGTAAASTAATSARPSVAASAPAVPSASNSPAPVSLPSSATAAPSASPGVSTTSGAATTPGNGTLLGSYTFTLPQYGSAPLGAAAPDQAQILSGTGRDVIWNTGAGGAPLQTGGGDQMLSLPSGATPTYQACKTDTLTSDEESNNAGTAYCIIETTGEMAGVTVASANLSQSPWYLVLHVMVWENSP
jgi:hypothetical protein